MSLPLFIISRFWSESLQNWQSEFVAAGALAAVISVYLRQKGSSQSKPVAHAHSETGDDAVV